MIDAVSRRGSQARPWLDRLDARTRIVAALALIVAVLLAPFATAIARVRRRLARPRMALRPARERNRRAPRPCRRILLVLLALLPLTVPGPALAAGPAGVFAARPRPRRADPAAGQYLGADHPDLLGGTGAGAFRPCAGGAGRSAASWRICCCSPRARSALIRQEALAPSRRLRARAFRASTSLAHLSHARLFRRASCWCAPWSAPSASTRPCAAGVFRAFRSGRRGAARACATLFFAAAVALCSASAAGRWTG